MTDQVFEGVQNFRYLGALLYWENLISYDMKLTAAGDGCFYSLR